MSLPAATQEALKRRQAEADAASQAFDFVREGSLATFWRQATPGTTYWRGYLPMLYLPGQVVGMTPNAVTYDEEAEAPLTLHPQQGDVAIWQFLGDDGRSRIALQMMRQGLRTLLEVDDTYLTFAPPLYGKHGSWQRTHREAVANGTGYSVEMHRKVTPQVDGVICSTDYLANLYEEYNDHVYVCPNSVDPTDWNVERVESDTLRIGYYGSPSHIKDWPLVKKAMKWAARQPGVEVVLVGFQPPGWSGGFVPWADDLMKGRQALGQLDVGIAPLKRNAWADGKSDVKAMEYAMAGVMPIVQDAPPYSPWKDMGWEWVASTEADWMTLIREIVANRDIVPTLARDAKEYVLANRTIQKNIQLWKEAVEDGA